MKIWRDGVSAGPLLDIDSWRYLGRYYQPRWPALLACALLASSQSLMVLPILWLVRHAFDTAIPAGDVILLGWIGLGLLLARAANSGLGLLTRWLTLRLVKDAVSRLRQDLLARLYGLSHAFHRLADADRLHTRLVQDTERIDTISVALLAGALPACFAILALLAVLLWLNPTLVALAAATVPMLWLAGRATTRIVRRNVDVFHRAFEDFSTGVHFMLRHIGLTRQQSWEVEELNRQRGHIEQLRRTGIRMAMGYALHSQLQSNVTGLAAIVILAAGGMAVARHAMTLGQLLSFYVAAGLLNTYVERIVGVLPELINGNASLAKLRALHDAGPRVAYDGRRRLEFTGRVELDSVDFSYGDVSILRAVSLTVDPGARVAIIGPNGTGKTTLLDLVAGFARPASGGVLADGVPYDTLDLAKLRRSIGMVPQHPEFFTGTVFANLAYGRPDATRDQVAAAVRHVQGDAFMRRMEHGYDTEMADGGAPFSAGECQRLAIARALLGDPRLLILDEPTTHLDVLAVRAIMAGLNGATGRPAILIVSHDPEVVRFADSIWRLESGRLHRVDVTAAPA